MKNNRTIRIIKGADRSRQSAEATNQAASPAPAVEAARPAAREVAGNVAAWVKEFRQRRRPDPRSAFASLFAEQATPLGSLS